MTTSGLLTSTGAKQVAFWGPKLKSASATVMSAVAGKPVA